MKLFNYKLHHQFYAYWKTLRLGLGILKNIELEFKIYEDIFQIKLMRVMI